MDSSVARERDREAFRGFLERHRYAPQGRYARVGPLDDKDLDALMRGNLRGLWAWAWENIKNAEDMEIIQRNVHVARYQVDSCKRERDVAKEQHSALESRRRHLLESLQKAKARESALLTTLRTVEQEKDQLVNKTMQEKQREVLRHAFNDKNRQTIDKLADVVEQLVVQATVPERRTIGAMGTSEMVDSPVDVLLREYKRMVKSTSGQTQDVEFGESDIAHLREYGGRDVLMWLLENANRPPCASFDDPDDVKYADHVEEHTSSSHDALIQVQTLLRQSQQDHIATFTKTQKTYATARDLKRQIDQERMARSDPNSDQYELWGVTDSCGDPMYNAATELADLQIDSQVHAIALNHITRSLANIEKQVADRRQLKEELNSKVDLMNQFDERQLEIVARIRNVFRNNQELIDSLGCKQSSLLEVMKNEIAPKAHQEFDTQLLLWRKLVLDELRQFSTMRLEKYNTTSKTIRAGRGALVETARHVAIDVPVEELYINQLHDGNNGFNRVARALRVAQHSGWASIIARLEATEDEENAAKIREQLHVLEKDVAEYHGQTIPETQALLALLSQQTEDMNTRGQSTLQDVLATNAETATTWLPELRQAIENWYHRPGWAANPGKAVSKTK